MADLLSFFRADGDGLMPTEMALSSWGRGHLHGVAVSGALGREVERVVAGLGRDDLTPTRHSVDLFRPATMAHCDLSSTVVRNGPRLCLVDVVLSQGGEPVARSSTTWLKQTEPTPGRAWEPSERPALPPLDVVPESSEPRVPFLHSSAGWSQNFGEHQNDARKSSWSTAVPIVAGEPLTPFQAVSSIADGINLVVSWGTRGVEHINSDVTLTLARRPVGTEIGLEALDRVEGDGVAVGAASVFDREGPLGNVVMTSLANLTRAIDMTGNRSEDDGSRGTTPGA